MVTFVTPPANPAAGLSRRATHDRDLHQRQRHLPELRRSGTMRAMLGQMPDQELLEAVIRLAREAGESLMLPAFRGGTVASRDKPDGSIVTETDFACQDFFQRRLSELTPGISLLSEEMPEETAAQIAEPSASWHAESVWCLDPLDGTGNFAAGFPCFAISLALLRRGTPLLGVIHDPVRGETFSALAHRGAWLNGQPIRAGAGEPLAEAIGFLDFKRLPATLASRLAATPFCRSLRNIGSCALEWAWLAAGRARFIIHGGEKLWDYAAGALIAAEAGCMTSDFEGRPLFPRDELDSPVLAAASPALHEELSALVASPKS